ncbi:MAG: type VI secretion system contractile sheath large subunit, partial [Kangiellaceae bacterium]|nr:type VI secretion system contractile sheath large subunit [Kangiellaceae bacterium]
MQSSTSSIQNSNKQSTVDFDSLLLRSPYITNTDEFLSETEDKKSLVYWLKSYAIKSRLHSPQDIKLTIQESIAAIDELINEQLNQIIHHQRFQKLEASWRGLKYLVTQATETKNIKIRILDINWNEVVKDTSRAIEFDQSHLFQKIYSEEYGTPGGEPY